MIQRAAHLRRIDSLLRRFRIVSLVGARQVGKTTLARQVLRGRRPPPTVFDLEDPTDLARLEDPMLALRDLRGLVVIDEVQRKPGLFPILRVLADRPRSSSRFLILGSASPALLRQRSESLAGRIFYHTLGGFSLSEVGAQQGDRLWIRGGFPRSYLARSSRESLEWRRSFIQTFLERDIPQLGFSLSSETLHRFWTMLAHYHGQIWNASEFARSFGMSDMTIRRYLDILTETFMVRVLRPWKENLKKRQVGSPKVYLADSGILHALLNLATKRDLEGHPKLGASWEGFALAEVVGRIGARPEECYFWATHAGAELDLLVHRGRKRLGFEFKRGSSPKVSRSMSSAMRDLGLHQLYVVYPGSDSFPLAPKIQALAFSRILDDLPPLT